MIFAPSVLNDLDAQNWNALFGPPINTHRASIDLPPVDDVREFMFTDHPWLAADPTLGPWDGSADLDVVHTRAWILPDERPLPAELVAFLDVGNGIGFQPRKHRNFNHCRYMAFSPDRCSTCGRPKDQLIK